MLKDTVDSATTLIEKIPKLADHFISCKLPANGDSFRNVVSQVQTHKHTQSCLKRTGTCRYGIPRPPSKQTFVAGPPPDSMTDKEKEDWLEKSTKVMKKAMDFLDSHSSDLSNLTWEVFLKELGIESYNDSLDRSVVRHFKKISDYFSIISPLTNTDGFIYKS